MQHTITLDAVDEAAFALKLERHNRNRADRRLDPATADEYLAEVVSAVLGPERDELAREREQRIEQKLGALPKARRDAILAELGEE